MNICAVRILFFTIKPFTKSTRLPHTKKYIIILDYKVNSKQQICYNSSSGQL